MHDIRKVTWVPHLVKESLFIIVINLIFMFSLLFDALTELGALMRALSVNRSLMYFCIKSSIETQGEIG